MITPGGKRGGGANWQAPCRDIFDLGGKFSDRPQKKIPVLQAWPTQIFRFGRFSFFLSFFFLIVPKSCKISRFFDQNLKNLAENFWK